MWLFILHKVEYEVKDKAKREVITWNIGKKEISIENIRTLLSSSILWQMLYCLLIVQFSVKATHDEALKLNIPGQFWIINKREEIEVELDVTSS